MEASPHKPISVTQIVREVVKGVGPMAVQSGVELPYQAVRYQIADAINLVLHLGRAHGARVVRELIRISGYDPQRDRYESDVLFSQDVAEEKPMSALVGTSGPLPDETSHNTKRES